MKLAIVGANAERGAVGRLGLGVTPETETHVAKCDLVGGIARLDSDGLRESQFGVIELTNGCRRFADGRPEARADGHEWRTAPLGGLAAAVDEQGAGLLLHDGRARSLEEAILWHGGEAEKSREAYKTLSAADRAALLRWLRSL